MRLRPQARFGAQPPLAAALSVEMNPGRVPCAIQIISFQNFKKVLKTCAGCRKHFFDSLTSAPPGRMFFRQEGVSRQAT